MPQLPSAVSWYFLFKWLMRFLVLELNFFLNMPQSSDFWADFAIALLVLMIFGRTEF